MRTAIAAAALVTFAVAAEAATNVTFDAGADFRVRQEISLNTPGLPGNPKAMMPKKVKKDLNHIRFRPRAWARVDAGDFGFYVRLADEMREHIVDNGVRRSQRSYNCPDEIVVDNLYLEGRGLFDGFLDFRAGRQDLFDGRHSVMGLDRLVIDGAPYVGSRSCYADMLRFTLRPTETGRLDLFGLYDAGENLLRFGDSHSKDRPMNAIHPGDDQDRDEWGLGAVWYDELGSGEDRLPYRVYAIGKGTTSYGRFDGVRMGRTFVTTFGAWTKPKLTRTLSLELEGAGQAGNESDGGDHGGWMSYAALDWRAAEASSVTPFAGFSAYFLSPEWDPMWARAPMDSELFQYGTLQGLGYWNNMLYTKVTVGLEFSPRHRVLAYTGPMWAAENDGWGCSESDPGTFKGVLSAARYDFPLFRYGRIDVFGHLLAELFNPGDYYESDKPSCFLRWEVTFRF